MNSTDSLQRAKQRVWRLLAVILVVFGAVTVLVANWVVRSGPAFRERADNPRLVASELAIQRGQLLDANDVVLAETVPSDAGGQRNYPLARVGPAVGYYSFRYGTAGAEEAFDSVLRGDDGDFWRRYWEQEVLHNPQAGRDVRLTLDARWQLVSDELLGPESGAVLLFSLADGSIQAMVSHPTFDANTLEETFDRLVDDAGSPLLNRVTQGQYQAGLALQPLFLAAAAEAGIIRLTDKPDDVMAEVLLNGRQLTCEDGASEDGDWAGVLAFRCPGPMVEIGRRLGEVGARQALTTFDLLVAPEISIGSSPVGQAPIGDPVETVLGQGDLLVSPLQVGLAWGALANEGVKLRPKLLDSIQQADGSWQRAPSDESTPQAVGVTTARAVYEIMLSDGGTVGHEALVPAGPQESKNAWYLGAAPAADPVYAVVVLIEKAEDTERAKEIGQTLLKRVLDPDGP